MLGDDGGAHSRGECTDNAVAAVGIILEQMQLLHVQLPYEELWGRWLRYLPLRTDKVSCSFTTAAAASIN